MVVIPLTRGAKALTVYPYSVILKRAKNTDTDGVVLYPHRGLRTVVLNQKDNTLPCLGTRGILKYIRQPLTLVS